ncbi:hypothetical protein SL67_02949 [Klebsiella pneumoniae]|nr:hypothetical protein SL67_02949 [Klebsiella pneumoniae]
MAPGAHRGRPVTVAPCTPGLWPAKSPLRGPFDLSLQASGRAEAASLQNTALSPHPCGLPRPAGNVSAILRPSAPAVSARKVNKLTTGRTNVGRVRRSRHPAQNRLRARCPCPAALRMPDLLRRGCWPGKAPAATRHKAAPCPAALRWPGLLLRFCWPGKAPAATRHNKHRLRIASQTARYPAGQWWLRLLAAASPDRGSRQFYPVRGTRSRPAPPDSRSMLRCARYR